MPGSVRHAYFTQLSETRSSLKTNDQIRQLSLNLRAHDLAEVGSQINK